MRVLTHHLLRADTAFAFPRDVLKPSPAAEDVWSSVVTGHPNNDLWTSSHENPALTVLCKHGSVCSFSNPCACFMPLIVRLAEVKDPSPLGFSYP